MYRWYSSTSRLGHLIVAVVGCAMVIGILATPLVYAARAIKPLALPTTPAVPTNTTIYDVHGTPIAVLHGDENRTAISRKAMPRSMREAVVAAEDRNFFQHGGVSIGGIVRALTTDVGSGDVMQGGSTITQQYARNAFDQIGTARTVDRKVKEALLAVRLENELSKDEILDRYLNTVYFGRGAYGIEAAAEAFFATHAPKLTLAQSAYLAGIIRAPEIYDRDLKLATQRRNEVLGIMAQLADISQRQLRLATQSRSSSRNRRIRRSRPGTSSSTCAGCSARRSLREGSASRTRRLWAAAFACTRRSTSRCSTTPSAPSRASSTGRTTPKRG
ncbi:MAG: transglycosylase domain-containing protein [Actinomycetota bacterium]